MEVEHLGLGRDDTIFIPTPLAHQTGLLYGMWLAFALGSTQVIQDVWDAERRRPARCGEWDGHLRAGGDAVPRRPRPRRRVGRGGGAAGAADLRRHRRRGAAGARRARDHRARRPPSAAPGARPSPASAPSPRPGDDPAKVWGTDGRALAGTRIRIVDDAGQRARPRRGGQLPGDLALPLRGVPRPSRPDRRGDDARRLVPDRRPGDDRRRRLPAHHRPGQGHHQPRWREGAGRRDRAAAPPAPRGRRGGDRGDARRAARRARLRLRRPRSRLERRLRPRRGPRPPRRAPRSSKFYWPERVETIDEMPRTPSGKIQKFVLRDRAKGLRPEEPKPTSKEPVR